MDVKGWVWYLALQWHCVSLLTNSQMCLYSQGEKGGTSLYENELCLSICCVTGMPWKEHLCKEKWPAGSLPWPSSNFAGGKKALHRFSSSRIQWKRWNTLMEDYDLTHKSMAMNMCLTILKEMVEHSGSSPVTVGELTKWGIKNTGWLNLCTPTPPATSSSYYIGPNYPV